MYVYGKLDMGAFSKTIFVRPLRAMPTGTLSSSNNVRGSFVGNIGNLITTNNHNISSSGTRGSVSGPSTTLSNTRMSVSFTGENLPAFPLPEPDLALALLPSPSASPEANMASLEQKLCLFPGLSDMAAFRECLTSATFVLQVKEISYYFIVNSLSS